MKNKLSILIVTLLSLTVFAEKGELTDCLPTNEKLDQSVQMKDDRYEGILGSSFSDKNWDEHLKNADRTWSLTNAGSPKFDDSLRPGSRETLGTPRVDKWDEHLKNADRTWSLTNAGSPDFESPLRPGAKEIKSEQ